jgi:hypothetical protein
MLFTDPAHGDFTLTSGSPFYGKNLGANVALIDAAIGTVKNVRLQSVGRTSAVVAFTRPSDEYCTVQYGLKSGQGGPKRTSEVPSSLGYSPMVDTMVQLSGLNPGSQYLYALMCPKAILKGSFTTLR